MILSPFIYSTTASPFFDKVSLRDVEPLTYVKIVGDALAGNWTSTVGFPWSMFTPAGVHPRIQGWKIHLSANASNAEEVLTRTIGILVEASVPFKVLSSPIVLKMSLSKNWDRRAAGKFVTIYPSSDESCRILLDALSKVTTDLIGPYLLTDLPYKDSRVVYYRYGAHLGRNGLAPGGEREHLIEDPTGKPVPDLRLPYFITPDWITSNPFLEIEEDREVAIGDSILLNNGRYEVTGALRYSGFGGLYVATDLHTGKPVVIREARPHAEQAKTLLHHEASVLKRLSSTNRVPAFIEAFDEEGHSYLVQSKVEGVSLWGHGSSFLVTYEGKRTPEELLKCVVECFRDVVHGLATIHSHSLVLRDLTKLNILIDSEGWCRFIDFELSYDLSSTASWTAGGTAGYTSPNQLANGKPQVEDDYFALGALLLDLLTFTAPALGLARRQTIAALRMTLEECGLPDWLAVLVDRLTSINPSDRPAPPEIIHILDSNKYETLRSALDPIMIGHYSPPLQKTQKQDLLDDLDAINKRIRQHILQHMTLDRADRLWPASAELFETNPISLRLGGSGIVMYLQNTGGLGSHEEQVWKWIAERTTSSAAPPGFYSGQAGVAWLLALNGRMDASSQLIDRVLQDPRYMRTPGLHDGQAGVGLCALALSVLLGRPSLLTEAVAIGERLGNQSHLNSPVRSRWWGSKTLVPVGFGAGASGIALFYIHLYRATGLIKYIKIAFEALNYDIGCLVRVGERVYLPEVIPNASAAVSPHVRYGTAGLVAMLLRYRRATDDNQFDGVIRKCLLTIASRQTNKLWQDWGLAGFGETLIDAYNILKEDSHYDASLHIGRKLLTFAVPHGEGIAYLGNELVKFNTDWGLGSAGIGSYINRLRSPHLSRSCFFDELFIQS